MKTEGFAAGFLKVAAPAWFHELHKSMHPLKAMKNFSHKGVSATKTGKKLK